MRVVIKAKDLEEEEEEEKEEEERRSVQSVTP